MFKAHRMLKKRDFIVNIQFTNAIKTLSENIIFRFFSPRFVRGLPRLIFGIFRLI